MDALNKLHEFYQHIGSFKVYEDALDHFSEQDYIKMGTVLYDLRNRNLAPEEEAMYEVVRGCYETVYDKCIEFESDEMGFNYDSTRNSEPI